VNFGYGGYQEARGSGINAGQHFYIENVLEELDSPAEFYFNASTSQLFFLPNASTNLPTTTFALPVLNSVIVVNGSSGSGGSGGSGSGSGSGGGVVRGVSFAGINVTQTRPTFLEQ